ncbi:MAG: DNA modification methylase [Euryarchaeota archaeon]|nr:DNA modification methylase [Euryarchaeota archaeon]
MYRTYHFDLLGECGDMPVAETLRCIEAECEEYRVIRTGPGYVTAAFDPKNLDAISERLSLAHCMGRHLGAFEPGDFSGLGETELPEGSFAIRGKRFKGLMKDVDSQDLIVKAGKLLSKCNDVDLRTPDLVIQMHMSDRVNLFIEERHVDKDLLRKRKVSERPFFSPISLHPKYARALINLTGARRGDTLLDPFCGTGGIAIEAADMGMRTIVSDFDEEMIFGCQENLDFYGLKAEEAVVADIGDVPGIFANLDAVATDPPYGRSTKTGGERVDRIYARAMDSIARVLKPDSRAGLVLPQVIRTGPMTLENVFDQYVHGSLTRHYHIFHTCQ